MHSDSDAAAEGELEGVGEQVEDNLLPEVPVDVGRRRGWRRLDFQAQSAALKGGAKHAGQFGGEGGQIGRQEMGLYAAGLQPGELEQRVDQLEQAEAVAMDHLQLAGEA